MQLYLAAAPCYLPEASRWRLPIAHAAYRIDGGGRLAALAMPPDTRGGLLLVTETDCPAPPQPDVLARDILRQCLHRGCTGVVLEPVLSAAALNALAELCRRFGAQRLALDLACVRADFSLPAPYGDGAALSAQQLAALRGQRPVFFSPELCARYFTYGEGGMTHFVLFDDADTLRRKMSLAAELGIGTGFLSLPESAEALPQLLGR